MGNGRPTPGEIRDAIEARIDRILALEELVWKLRTFSDDIWGPLPDAWSTRVAELGVTLSRAEDPSDG
ncbi:MAG TPA: hypothetical protein VIK65_13510, partial [Candidatus Limnocylindrales bacterium]